MNITYRKATHKDIDTLIKLRLDYLTADRGELSKEETEAVVSQLRDYFPKQLNSSFIAFLAVYDGQAVSTVFMAVAEKPANPAFITGKIATILNVFTYPRIPPQGDRNKITHHVDQRSKDDEYFLFGALRH